MKKAWLVACALALTSSICFAQTPSDTPVDIAAILSPAAVTGSCDTLQTEMVFAAAALDVTCTTSCGLHGSMSCPTGTSSCSAVNRDCPNRGSITCDDVTTQCPPCTIEDSCFECTQSGGADCFSCCRCNGGTFIQCATNC